MEASENKQLYSFLSAFNDGGIADGPDAHKIIIEKMAAESDRIFGTDFHANHPNSFKEIFNLACLNFFIAKTEEKEWKMTIDGLNWMSFAFDAFVDSKTGFIKAEIN